MLPLLANKDEYIKLVTPKAR